MAGIKGADGFYQICGAVELAPALAPLPPDGPLEVAPPAEPAPPDLEGEPKEPAVPSTPLPEVGELANSSPPWLPFRYVRPAWGGVRR